ncbi:MAG: hypothetical protein VW620_13230 [Rhodospirillales bacterium]
MTKLYRIPKCYYIDHEECGCEAPEVVKATKQHYWISAEDCPELYEFRSRAHFYATGGIDAETPYLSGLVASAKATIKVIGKNN